MRRLKRGPDFETTYHRVSNSRAARLFGYVFIVVFLFILGAQSEGAKDAADQANRNQIAAAKAALVAQAKINAEQEKATIALCSFVEDLRLRVEDQKAKLRRSREFLKEHPNGISGISKSVIQAGVMADENTLRNQQRTLRSLDQPLDCP